jgi:hypothetical protein
MNILSVAQPYSTYPFASHEEGYDYLLPLRVFLWYNGTGYNQTKSAILIRNENEKIVTCLQAYAQKFKVNGEYIYQSEIYGSFPPFHTNEAFLLIINNKTYALKTFQLSDSYHGTWCSPSFHWIELDLYTGKYWNGYDSEP